MKREWKPGDVAIATVNGRPNVRVVAGWSRYDPQLRWCELSPRWADGDDDKCWFMPSQVTDARPLVVIDPEDRSTVVNLAQAVGSVAAQPGEDIGRIVNAVGEHLRSLIEPPRCTASLNIMGEHIGCDREPGHGLVHGSTKHDAIWQGSS